MIEVDLCVIGAGSGGLTVAAGASQMGARVALIERAKMGGDCLNYGCVPSKALIAAARAAHEVRHARRFGVAAPEPQIDFAAVNDHVRGVIAGIAPHDSQARFEGLGVTVIRAPARFTGPNTVSAGEAELRAKWFVLATGSSPLIPPVPGLDSVPYLTNETVFDLRARPGHLVVLGGGPIGLELAQAHRRLGCQVTVIEKFAILGKDDPELADVVRARLLGEGVAVLEGAEAVRAERLGTSVALTVKRNGEERRVTGTHLLVAVGRKANVEGLGLERAGIAYTEKGIAVGRRLRTANRRVFAVGDVAGPYLFTHMASQHAGVVLRNILFRQPAKVDARAVPWVTFTDPELAHVGQTEDEARKTHGTIRIVRFPFHDNDRAHAERDTEGFVKVVVGRRGRVAGASIVGPRAGELLQPWCLAVANAIPIGRMAGLVVPYPTLGEVNKRVAGAYFLPSLFSERTRRIVRLLMRLA